MGVVTTAFRGMGGSIPSRQRVEVVLAHLHPVQTVATEVTDEKQRGRLAAGGSETASLAGWLSWDLGDHGSAPAAAGDRQASGRVLPRHM